MPLLVSPVAARALLSRFNSHLAENVYRKVGPRVTTPKQPRPLTIQRSVPFEKSLGEVVDSPEKFAVTFDVSQFKPDELKVNVVGNELIIEGCHDIVKKENQGTLQKSLLRKYIIPEDANIEDLRSSLSDTGQLRIETSKKSAEMLRPRVIPVSKD